MKIIILISCLFIAYNSFSQKKDSVKKTSTTRCHIQVFGKSGDVIDLPIAEALTIGTIIMEDCDSSEIISFDLTVSTNGQLQSSHSASSYFTSQMKDLINHAATGDFLLISNVRYKTPGGKVRVVKGMKINIK